LNYPGEHMSATEGDSSVAMIYSANYSKQSFKLRIQV
jgi:hypothetical protein